VIVAVTAHKGGVGKTTAAVHLAAFLERRGDTVLIDGDDNRSATRWTARGGLPFRVVDESQGAEHIRKADYAVIDTAAGVNAEDLADLASGVDLVVIPTSPDALALDALMLTVAELQNFNVENFRVLLNICPPPPSRDAEEARKALKAAKIPVLKAQIRRLVAFQKAALAGIPVYGVRDPRAEFAWKQCEQLGREILKWQK